MGKRLMCFCFVILVAIPAFATRSKQLKRIEEAGVVMNEIMGIPEGSIPRDLLRKAECVVIVPSMKKAAFGVGGNYGKGCMLCRNKESWSSPVMVEMTGGSFGLQLGGTSTDVILLVMNKRGVNKLLQSKVTLGGDASAAAGPKGRSAAAMTDVQMRAEILSYARSRGLFAGIALNGSALFANGDDNEDLYGKRIEARDILFQGGAMPPAAKPLVDLLLKYPSIDQIDPVEKKEPDAKTDSDK